MEAIRWQLVISEWYIPDPVFGFPAFIDIVEIALFHKGS